MIWVTTASGRKWDLMNPKASDFNLYDVTTALAHTHRFNGALGPYSVAEHSCHVHDAAVSMGMPRIACFYALFHDAHEAYVGDIVTPVCKVLDEMMQIGLKHDNPHLFSSALGALKIAQDEAIFEAIKLDYSLLDPKDLQIIRWLDLRAMVTERDHLGKNQPNLSDRLEQLERLDFRTKLWSPEVARSQFMSRASNYIPEALFENIRSNKRPTLKPRYH